MHSSELIPHARLLELLEYDPETGIFRWRVDRYRKTRAGEVAGSFNKRQQRWCIGIEYGIYPRDRLAWYYQTGVWPDQVEHENRNKQDDRWDNLRMVPRSEGKPKVELVPEVEGIEGVNWDKFLKRWVAYIHVDDRYRHLGSFDRLEDAAQVATLARERYADRSRKS